MLLRFSVDNYRSFGREMILDLSASNGIKDNPGKGFFQISPSERVLNSVAIYGANSSGKSNFLMAVGTMRKMVLQSVRLNEGDTLPYDPFLLSTTEQRPTRFEVKYFEPESRSTFTYGFEYNEESIIREWLIAKMPRRSEKRLLYRESGQSLQLDAENYDEGVRASNTLTLNKNRLFLSLAGQAGGAISNRVINWFKSGLRTLSGIEDTYSQYTRRRVFDDEKSKSLVQDFIAKMDLGFNTIIPQKVDIESLGFPQGLPQELITQLKKDPIIRISSIHNVYDEHGGVAKTLPFDMDEHESAGSRKIFNLSGPILDALSSGMTLLVDELDSKMHPLISRRLVEMFNSPEENPYSAQLVFTTHDTNLLSRDVFRRDQIWFTEKDKTEQTTIYPMMKAQEYNSQLNHAPRSDSNYQKNYIQGLYGAIPFLTCEKLG